MNVKILILAICFLCFSSFGQDEKKSKKAYWDAVKVAHGFYDEADYVEAVKAYNNSFKLNQEEEIASHRLYAAASNCMIDQEEGVRENLFALLPVSTSNDMKKVLVNYEIFRKYHHTDWWKELDTKMDLRLESLIAHHKNLKIFQHGRNMIYRAIRISSEGDTLANTTITMKPDGTGWGSPDASLQSQAVYVYQFSEQDSLDHIEEVIKVVGERFWIKTDTTGVIENDKKLSIHPMRNNEFFKTEIAPFPEVVFPISKETIHKANSKTMIFSNWGTYNSSETTCEYSYVGEETRSYVQKDNLKCYKFHAIGFNNFHGMSEIDYFFNEDLGFVEMIYKTYDDETISFVLEKIEKE